MITNEITLHERTLTNINFVLSKYLLYGVEVMINNNEVLTQEYLDSNENLTDRYYYTTKESNLENYGVVYVNGIIYPLSEVESIIAENGFANYTDLCFFSCLDSDDALYEFMSEHQLEWSKWLEIQGKEDIEFFWSTEEEED